MLKMQLSKEIGIWVPPKPRGVYTKRLGVCQTSSHTIVNCLQTNYTHSHTQDGTEGRKLTFWNRHFSN